MPKLDWLKMAQLGELSGATMPVRVAVPRVQNQSAVNYGKLLRRKGSAAWNGLRVTPITAVLRFKHKSEGGFNVRKETVKFARGYRCDPRIRASTV